MKIIENIRKIRIEKNVKQETLADALGFDVANYSRIENKKQELKVNQLEIIANVLSEDVIYLFTYPKRFVDKATISNSERISVTFEVSPDKKDFLLNLVTGKEDSSK